MFVCLLFVCLCTRLFESMLIFMLECLTTKETLGNFHQHGFLLLWITKLGSFCSFSILTLLHISKHCTSMQTIIITSRVSCYREFNNLSDDTKHASIITEIREQLLIKLRFPNFFWAVYICPQWWICIYGFRVVPIMFPIYHYGRHASGII